jgi:hypothetical protein
VKTAFLAVFASFKLNFGNLKKRWKPFKIRCIDVRLFGPLLKVSSKAKPNGGFPGLALLLAR